MKQQSHALLINSFGSPCVSQHSWFSLKNKNTHKKNTFTIPFLGFIIYSAVPARETSQLEDGQTEGRIDRSNYLELHRDAGEHAGSLKHVKHMQKVGALNFLRLNQVIFLFVFQTTPVNKRSRIKSPKASNWPEAKLDKYNLNRSHKVKITTKITHTAGLMGKKA